VVPVPDEIDIAYLDQRHGWQFFPLLPGSGDAQPACPVVIPERVKVAVKVGAAPFTAQNLIDRYRPQPDIAVGI
jgi:hypothetical protein